VTVEAGRLTARALKQLAPHLDRPDGRIDGQPGQDVIPAIVANVVPLIAAARTGLTEDDPLLATLRGQTEEILTSADTQLAMVEQAFTVMAEHLPLRHLKDALAEQVDAVLPTELEEKAEQARRRRSLKLDRDRRAITITPDDELYELTHTALAATVATDPDNPTDTDAARQVRDRAIHGEQLEPTDVEADGDVRFPRSRAERLHDAMTLILQRYLAADLTGSQHKAPVRITVTLPLEKLEKRPGALPAVGASGRRLPASLIGRWWCDATITALITSTGMIPLGATHTGRTLTALERKASLIQHGRACDGQRCCTNHDPLVTLVPHHLYSYAKHQKTSIAETIWLCDSQHDALHRGNTIQHKAGRWLNSNGFTTPPRLITP
jgi:hypothetical protein